MIEKVVVMAENVAEECVIVCDSVETLVVGSLEDSDDKIPWWRLYCY